MLRSYHLLFYLYRDAESTEIYSPLIELISTKFIFIYPQITQKNKHQ